MGLFEKLGLVEETNNIDNNAIHFFINKIV